MMINPKKKRVPTKIKRLAEKRARILGRLVPFEEIETELIKQVEALSSQLSEINSKLELQRKQKLPLIVQLQQCDDELVALNPLLDPSKIKAIKASKGRYGNHGTLKATVLDVIEAASPNYITTPQIMNAVISKLELVFDSNVDQFKWKDSSLKTSLYKLSLSGKIEQGPKRPNTATSPTNTWRIKTEASIRLIDL